MNRNTLKIATCQHEVNADLDANLFHILQLINDAKNQEADIAHFPECNLVGYGGLQHERIEANDYEPIRSAIGEIKNACKNHSMYAVFGTHVFEKGISKPFNSLILVNSEGDEVCRYDKRILTGTEGTLDHKYYQAGSEPIIAQVHGVNCGFVICHEWRYPELYREYKRLGAQVIFHSWFDGGLSDKEYKSNGQEEGSLIVGSVRGYAANNYLWVSGSNISTPESCFGSFIAQPDGRILKQMRRNETGHNGE